MQAINLNLTTSEKIKTQEKKYIIRQTLGNFVFYVRRIYCGRIIASSYKSDAKFMTKDSAEKMLKKCSDIDNFNPLEIIKTT